MDFGEAIRSLKEGKKVAREGWNGKGMYLFLSPSLGCKMQKQQTGESINDLQPFIVMKTADGTLVPWLASQTDVLAEDWIMVNQASEQGAFIMPEGSKLRRDTGVYN